jgi:hypothetical protein
MMDNIGQMSPDAILKNWMAFAPEQFQDFFKSFGSAAKAK